MVIALVYLGGALGSAPSVARGQGHNLEVVGSIGGRAQALEVVGERVYMGEGGNFLILDISDPTSPTLLSRVFCGQFVEEIRVVSSRAYVAAGTAGLKIFDISDPTSPILIGTYDPPGPVIGVDSDGSIAYAADPEGGLQIVDVSVPSMPKLITVVVERITDVSLSGHLLYFSKLSSSEGLGVFDVSDPADLRLVSRARTTGSDGGKSIVVHEPLAFISHYTITADDLDGIDIFDVSDPTEPKILETILGGFSYVGAAVADSRVYVNEFIPSVEGNTSGLVILDDSDLSLEAALGRYHPPGAILNVKYFDGFLYTTNADFGLEILDVSDAAQPVVVGRFETLGQKLHELVVQNSYAYVADADRGLRIVDVSDPLRPSLVGGFGEFRFNSHFVGDLIVRGNRAYVAGSPDSWILDIADPTDPILLSAYDDETARSVDVNGDHMFVADWDNGLEVYDITDPTAPTIVGNLERELRPRDIVVSNGFVYLVDASSGFDGSLRIIDVSDPTSPLQSGEVSDLPRQARVGVQGTLLALNSAGSSAFGDFFSGVRIFDITDPVDPIPLAALGRSPTSAVHVTDSMVYAIAGGLRAFDVSDTAAIVLRAVFPTKGRRLARPSSTAGVFALGSHVYLADGLAGLFILEFTGGDVPSGNDAVIEEIGTPSAFQAEGFFPALVAGNTLAQIEIRVTNIGSAGWTQADGYRLAAVEDLSQMIVIDQSTLLLPVDSSIEPNGQAAFIATIRTPREIGLYSISFQMIQAPNEFFGQIQSFDLLVNEPAGNSVGPRQWRTYE